MADVPMHIGVERLGLECIVGLSSFVSVIGNAVVCSRICLGHRRS
jgi:hypothetical protein